MIRFGSWSIILLIGAVQGLFVSIGLLTKSANRQANLFLSGLIFLLSLKLVPYIIGYAGFYMAYPWLDLAPFDLSLGFGPLLYLYLVRVTQAHLPDRWQLHLVPLAAQFLIYSGLFIQPLSFKHQFESTIGSGFNTADNLLDCLSFCLYLGLAWKVFRAYEARLGESSSNLDRRRTRPLRASLGGVTLTFSAFVAAKLWTIFIFPLTYYQMFPVYILLTVMVYLFGLIAFEFSQVEYGFATGQYKETDWVALAAGYSDQFESSNLWQDPLLSLPVAAKALGVSEGKLSKAINLGLGVTFSVWVNRLRIERVAELLRDTNRQEPILDVAFRCGFNSKASFNRWFREIQGCTPTEFRRGLSASLPTEEPGPVQPQYPSS